MKMKISYAGISLCVALILILCISVTVSAASGSGQVAGSGTGTGDTNTGSLTGASIFVTQMIQDTWDFTIYWEGGPSTAPSLLVYGPLMAGNNFMEMNAVDFAPSKGQRNPSHINPKIYERLYINVPTWDNAAALMTSELTNATVISAVLDNLKNKGYIPSDVCTRILNTLRDHGLPNFEELWNTNPDNYIKFLITAEPVSLVYASTPIPDGVQSNGKYWDLGRRQEFYSRYQTANIGNTLANMSNVKLSETIPADESVRHGEWAAGAEWAYQNVTGGFGRNYQYNYVAWWSRKTGSPQFICTCVPGDPCFDPYPAPYEDKCEHYDTLPGVYIPCPGPGTSETCPVCDVETPPTTEGGFKEIVIKAWELLAAIPNEWPSGTPEGLPEGGAAASEKLGPNGPRGTGGQGLIEVLERSDPYSWGTLHEDNTSSGSHTCHCHDYEEEDGVDSEGNTKYKTNHDGDHTCSYTIHNIVLCKREFWWWWDPQVRVQFDESKLTGVPNVINAEDNQTGDPFTSVTRKPNIYHMTRKADELDLKFFVKGRVFDQYVWNRKLNGGSPNHKVTNNGGSPPTGSLPGNGAQYSGQEPLPFRDGFKISFNSHRFGKFDNENLTNEAELIPLAGYMTKTGTQSANNNDLYWDFMIDRDLSIRVRWKIRKSESNAFLAKMYGGHPGLNFKWGHGGDWGTSSSDSDTIWNQNWRWERHDFLNGTTTVYTDGCSCHSQSLPSPHPSNCAANGIGETDSGNTAHRNKGIHTPRAWFARTEIIEASLRGQQKVEVHHPDDLPWYIRKNPYGNDRLSFQIPSTVFEFSPTYKMYADYTLDGQRAMNTLTDTWVLAADTDFAQFWDVVDFNLVGGETVVRAPWSRDYDDMKAVDPNDGKPINVIKGGQVYHVDTNVSQLEVTAVIHSWDPKFFASESSNAARTGTLNTVEPSVEAQARAEMLNDNNIVQLYKDSINQMLAEIQATQPFGFYTNLVGGTSDEVGPGTTGSSTGGNSLGSNFRWYGIGAGTGTNAHNAQIFKGAPYTHPDFGTTMTIPEPTVEEYPKLRLKVSEQSAIGSATMTLDKMWRLNASWDVWDSDYANDGGQSEWSDAVFQGFVPDMRIGSTEQLQAVMTEQSWYVEDYEGILVTVLKWEMPIPAIRSTPATVYEKLSDSKSHMNQWSPQMLHPAIQQAGDGSNGSGDIVLIPAKSIAAGTFLHLPDLKIYPGGATPALPGHALYGSPNGSVDYVNDVLSDWQLTYKPYRFGLRGSMFDN